MLRKFNHWLFGCWFQKKKKNWESYQIRPHSHSLITRLLLLLDPATQSSPTSNVCSLIRWRNLHHRRCNLHQCRTCAPRSNDAISNSFSREPNGTLVQNAELFTLTYSAIMCQLLTDLEEVEEVNKQLDQM